MRVGVELFAHRPYEDVWIEQVAELAQVSRGLLYHYFPTKRDFFAAVVRLEGERMLDLTATDPAVPIREQLLSGLDAYLDYAQQHVHGFRAFHHAAAAGDPEIRAAYESNRAEQERRIVEVLEMNAVDSHGRSSAVLRFAVRGWLALVTSVCLDWLDEPGLAKEEVRDLCSRALLGAVL